MSNENKNRKVPLMLLALLASTCIWLYVVTVVDPDDTTTFSGIPVQFENMDVMQENDLMLTEGENASVSVRVTGRRSELKKLSRDNIVITVDVGNITTEGTHELNYNVTLPNTVAAGELTVSARRPSKVAVSVEYYTQKAVEIRPVFEGESNSELNEQELTDGSLVIDTDGMVIQPQTVTVTGPSSIVDRIVCAQISINLSQATKTINGSYPYVLLDADGSEIDREELVTDCDTVDIMVSVLKYKEVPLTIERVPGGGAKDENVNYTLSTEKIIISGDAETVDSIDSIEIGTLDYASITGTSSQKTYDVVLPEGVNNVSGVTEVTASIRITGLSVDTRTITEVKLENVPENMKATVISESMQLTLRGTTEALDALETESIIVSVDLSNFTQSGTYIIPVTVTIDSGLQVGAIGSKTLTILLS